MECFKFLGSHTDFDGEIDEVNYIKNEIGKVCGGIKKVFNCKSLRMNAKRRLYEEIVVPTALYRAET